MVPPTEHPDDFSSKFEDFEYNPRPQVWERLEAAAGEQGMGALSGQYANFEHAPDPRVWQKIEGGLHPGRRRRAAVMWWALAAGIALLLAWTGWQSDWLAPESSAGQMAVQNPIQVDPVPSVLPEVECQEGEGEAENYASNKQGLVPPVLTQPLAKDSSRPVDMSVPVGQDEDGGSSIWHQNRGQMQDVLLASSDSFERKAPRCLTAIEVSQSKVAIVGRPMLLEQLQADSIAGDEIDFGPKAGKKGLMAGLGTNYAPLVASAESYDYNSISQDNADPVTAFGMLVAGDESQGSRGYRENFSTPIIFNASVQKRLGKHWAAVVGLVYTQLRSTGSRKSGDWVFENSVRRQYLGISIAPRYHFLNRKHYSVYATLGGQYDYGLNSQYRSQDFENGIEASNVTSNYSLGGQALAKLGLGMDAGLTQRLNLNFQLSVLSYFYQSHYNLWSERVNWPAAQIGLNLEI